MSISVAAEACCGSRPTTARQAYDLSDAVFEGRIEHVRHPWWYDWLSPRFIPREIRTLGDSEASVLNLKLERAWKGVRYDHENVYMVVGPGCGSACDPGTAYVFYADRVRGRLYQSLCWRLGPPSDAAELGPATLRLEPRPNLMSWIAGGAIGFVALLA